MNAASERRSPGVPQPCWHSDRGIFDAIKKQLTYDQLVMGCIGARHPRPDELLLREGVSDTALLAWCDGGFKQDKTFETARRRGAAVGAINKQAPHTGRGEYLCALAAESPGDQRWWLSISRQKGGFTDAEQRIAALILRQQQARFNDARETRMGRLLVGDNWRLIHADPYIGVELARREGMFEQLTGALDVIVRQRHPSMAVGEAHDAQVELGGEPYWMCFHRHSALKSQRGAHWYVELRPLEEALPTVAAIEDDRIANAVAYLHDHFHEAPSLAEVAQSVDISPFHFHRLFTRQVGISPKQYLQRKQLQVARWLLQATRTPIGEIARLTGFASHGHFTSTFHRVTGVSPTDYRER